MEMQNKNQTQRGMEKIDKFDYDWLIIWKYKSENNWFDLGKRMHLCFLWIEIRVLNDFKCWLDSIFFKIMKLVNLVKY